MKETVITLMTMKVKRSNQMRSSSPQNNWRSYSKWIGPISINWLSPSREDHPKVWSSSPLSPGLLMGPGIERLWMFGLRKWKITFMPPRLVSIRPWNLPNLIWRAMPPHGGGRWGKRKGKPMATHGNFSRNVLNRNSFQRTPTTFQGANFMTLWMQTMTTCVNMWGLIPNSCLKLGICMS